MDSLEILPEKRPRLSAVPGATTLRAGSGGIVGGHYKTQFSK
jgi:hypothetical protein